MMDEIAKTARTYILQSIGITFILTVLFAIGSLVLGQQNAWLYAVAVSVSFSVIMSVTIGLVWRSLAQKNPQMLTTFYTSVSGFRMLLALVALAVMYVIVGRESMLPYALTFMVFYFIMLGHHSFYFARITNRK